MSRQRLVHSKHKRNVFITLIGTIQEVLVVYLGFITWGSEGFGFNLPSQDIS